MEKRKTPELTSQLRKNMVKIPDIIRKEASGITITGKTIYSVLFSTDIAIIRNSNADAVIAVYPFSPHPAITQAIMSVADIPVFCGVGGGITHGMRSANVALHAEFQGAIGVVMNAPTSVETIAMVKHMIAIPVVITVVSEFTDIDDKLEAGADIVNVSGGHRTVRIVEKIRRNYPDLPIIATGGNKEHSILETIAAGANAITYTPPTSGELLKEIMESYRLDEYNKSRTSANENTRS